MRQTGQPLDEFMAKVANSLEPSEPQASPLARVRSDGAQPQTPQPAMGPSSQRLPSQALPGRPVVVDTQLAAWLASQETQTPPRPPILVDTQLAAAIFSDDEGDERGLTGVPLPSPSRQPLGPTQMWGAHSSPSQGLLGPTQMWGARSYQPQPLPGPGRSAPVEEGLSQTRFFQQLSALIEWRAAGHLTEPEFIEAKHKLGLR